MRDDDALDLSAWEAPPPPPDLADAVIARMTAVAPVEPAAPRRSRWIAGGIVAVLAAAAIAFLVIARDDDARPVHDVVATRAMHDQLGGVGVDLDAGAALHWQREGDGLIVVTGLRGTAAWRVAPSEHLRIDAGAMGASVEATGASLRVEATMNAADVKTAGVTAAIAMATSLVTVVVYEGHVKATSGGQTVVVVPGSTATLAPNAPPRIADQVTGDAAKTVPTVADSLDAEAIQQGFGAVRETAEACGDDSGASGVVKVSMKVAPDGSVSGAIVKQSPDAALGACVAGVLKTATFAKTTNGGSFTLPFSFNGKPPQACDPQKAADLKAKAISDMNVGADAAALVEFENSYKCKPDPALLPVMLLTSCRSKNLDKAKRWDAACGSANCASVEARCLQLGIQVRP